MTYCTEAGLIVEVATDMRDPEMPKTILRVVNCLAFRDEEGKHKFRQFVPDPIELECVA